MNDLSIHMDDCVYLRPTTKIEPLSCRWYLWPHLISPVTRAFNLAFRYIPILKSFIANSAAHEVASHDPEFFCAPFAQLTERDVEAVRTLLQTTLSSTGALIDLAENLAQFSKQLSQSAKGQNLDHVYGELPDSLAGLVELGYDLANRPELRVIEAMAYAASIDTIGSEEVMFSSQSEQDRSFFLNTPRLEAEGRMFFAVGFADQQFDLLSAARISAIPYADLVRELRVDDASVERFKAMFQKHPPLRNAPAYCDAGVRVRYFGHACVLIQTTNVAVLIDPVVPFDRGDGEQRFTFDDLPDFIDYVFLTHNHQDHFVPEIFLQLRNRIGRILVPGNNQSCIADPSLKRALDKLGFANVDVLDALDEVSIRGGSIVSLPFYGEHADLNIHSKQGMFVALEGRKFLFLADADCVDKKLYERLSARLGNIDVLFIGMECYGAPLSWLYGPYLSSPPSRSEDESRRLSGSDCERAWAIVETFRCAQAFVYAMGQEPWLKHLLGLQYTPESKQIVESDRFVEKCRQAGIPASRLYGSHEAFF